MQDAIRRDADARIAVAGGVAAQAKADAAKADAEAAKANQATAEMRERATKLENDNLKLRETVATLEGSVADGAKEVAAIQIRAANAETAAAEANRKAAEADTNRLKLELAMEPRTVGRTYVADDELALFDGTKALILYVSNEEAHLLADQLRFVIENERVHWKFLGIQPVSEMNWSNRGYAYAADVVPGIALLTTMGEGIKWDSRANRAAKVLAWHLRANNLDAHVEVPTTGPAWPVGIDRDAVLITVGSKPQDYWTEKAWERATQSIERQEKSVPPELRYITPQYRQRQEDYRKERENSRQEKDAREDEEHRQIIEAERLRKSREP